MSAAPLFTGDQTLGEALSAHLRRLLIVDVGAGEYAGGGAPAYAPLLRCPVAEVVGFEPDRASRDAVPAHARVRILPYAIGDGEPHEFRQCASPMTSSLYEPNTTWLQNFENLAEFCRVVSRGTIETVKLDHVAEARDADYIKIDVQGATLLVLEGARSILATTLLVHTEVEFGPIYSGAPLFGDVQRFLGANGFDLHHFLDFGTPRLLSGETAFGRGQTRQLWADAVFVPSLARLSRLPCEALLRLATIAHDCYGIEDLAHHCLVRADAIAGTAFAPAYRAVAGSA